MKRKEAGASFSGAFLGRFISRLGESERHRPAEGVGGSGDRGGGINTHQNGGDEEENIKKVKVHCLTTFIFSFKTSPAVARGSNSRPSEELGEVAARCSELHAVVLGCLCLISDQKRRLACKLWSLVH